MGGVRVPADVTTTSSSQITRASPSTETHALSSEEIAEFRTQLTSRSSTAAQPSEANDLLLQQRIAAEATLAAVKAQLAAAEAKVQQLQADDKDSSRMRRLQEWSSLSKVIESTLLEQSSHSPAAEQLLLRAEKAAREASGGENPTAGVAAPAAEAETDPAKGGDAAAGTTHQQPGWSASSWVKSLDVSSLVAQSLLSRASRDGTVPAIDELAFMQMLAADEANGRDALLSLLRGGLLGKLADLLWEGCVSLRTTRAASGNGPHAKFCADPAAFTLTCASGLSPRASLLGKATLTPSLPALQIWWSRDLLRRS